MKKLSLLKILSILIFLSFSIAFMTGCTDAYTKVEADTGVEKVDPKYRVYFEYFDTVSYIYSFSDDTEEEFEANHTAVAEVLNTYHKLFDIYFGYSGMNNLSTVNSQAGKSPVEVDPLLIEFLLYAKELYTLTNGKTNIAMGAVLSLWHDCREDAIEDPENARIPDAAALEEASNHCDINDLIIDKEAGTVYLADPDMRLDVGAIGKGYATEKAAEMLKERGVTSYVLNIGGNIRAIGEHPQKEHWTVGITNPDRKSDKGIICEKEIKDTSMVTSGNYERYYTVDGVNYHHIIDPDTLMPAAYFSSITVITENSGLADALSTALFCMSYEEGKALVESIDGVEVVWIDLEYNIVTDNNRVLVVIFAVTALIVAFGIIYGSKFIQKPKASAEDDGETDKHDSPME